MFCHVRVVLATVILIHGRYLSLGLSLGSWKVIICRTNGRALCGQLWVQGWCESVHILRRTLAHLPTNPLDWANTGWGGSSTSGHWGVDTGALVVL